MEVDDLIGLNAFWFVGLLGIQPSEAEIAFGPDNEKSSGPMNFVKTCKVQISSVEDVNGPGFDEKVVEEIDLVDFAMGYEDQRGNAAPQIHQGMEFDRSFVLAELSPREKRQAEIDGGGIERINRLFQLDAEVFVRVKGAGLGYEDLGEVGVDSPIADLVGVSQGVSRHGSAKAHVIEFLLVAPQTSLDVAKTFAIGELSKSHTEELIPAGKGLDLVVALVALDTFLKFVGGKELHHLCENGFSDIHRPSPRKEVKEYGI